LGVRSSRFILLEFRSPSRRIFIGSHSLPPLWSPYRSFSFHTTGYRRFPLTKASVHPVLKTSSWRISVLIQTERRIDRWCPLSDRRIIWCYYLHCSSSAIHPAHLETGPSDHPTVPTSFDLLRSVPTTPTLCTDGIVGSSDGVFSFLFFARF
jgi:hypothetical protein